MLRVRHRASASRGAMTGTTLTEARSAPPRRLSGAESWDLAAAEYGRMLDALRTLTDDDWARPTDCTEWDVRGMLGHLTGAILTRDTWMHRVDIARASGRPMVLSAAHDGRIVEDCVLDWAAKHGRGYILMLDGAAGGSFAAAPESPAI